MIMLNEASTRAIVTRFWEGIYVVPSRKAEFNTLLSQILDRYSTPERHYHNLVHITKMLMFLIEREVESDNLDELVLATIFHDVIYDPQRGDNEERSARFAEENLGSFGFSEDLILRVRHLILCTKLHQVICTNPNSLIFIDADLLVFGAPPEEYDEYARNIRKEYAFVSDHDYRAGRPKVLQRYLDRASIYLTPDLEASHGARARANLHREISELANG